MPGEGGSGGPAIRRSSGPAVPRSGVMDWLSKAKTDSGKKEEGNDEAGKNCKTRGTISLFNPNSKAHDVSEIRFQNRENRCLRL